jgi:DNA-binding transcriptional ArsR family regulator
MKRLELDKPHKFFFETLGNQTRWDIIHLLLKKPHRATDISGKLGYEQSLVSHHLKRLEACGFVKAESSGAERIYHLNKETIEPLLRLVGRHVNKFCKKACVSGFGVGSGSSLRQPRRKSLRRSTYEYAS